MIERTGARMLLPSLCEWHAELATALGDEATRECEIHEAHRLFMEVGVTGHAERLARQLGPDG